MGILAQSSYEITKSAHHMHKEVDGGYTLVKVQINSCSNDIIYFEKGLETEKTLFPVFTNHTVLVMGVGCSWGSSTPYYQRFFAHERLLSSKDG